MKKDFSPFQLTIIIASLVSAICVVFLLVFQKLNNHTISIGALLIFLIINFSLIYVVVRYLLERFIYSRIKPIYKLISIKEPEKDKLSDKEFNSDVILKLNQEVSNWLNKTEEELVLLQSLEAYRKNYIGNISHELKTPLFSIQGYIHTLQEGVEDKVIRKKFLSRAAENTERLLNIVRDLETITKIESNTLQIKFESFNISKLLKDIFYDIEIQAKEKNIKFILGEGTDFDYLVKANKEAIRQVLSNLLVNSIKYGNENGNITVNFYDFMSHVMVEVVDNGIGIDPKHQKHIFDRFYRIDASRNRAIGGSGLGLSIVKHILDAHNQRITVKSELGKGSAFSFTLEKA